MIDLVGDICHIIEDILHFAKIAFTSFGEHFCHIVYLFASRYSIDIDAVFCSYSLLFDRHYRLCEDIDKNNSKYSNHNDREIELFSVFISHKALYPILRSVNTSYTSR